MTFDLWPFNPNPQEIPGYSKLISYTKFEHFGIFRFFSYAADKNKRTYKSYPYPPTEWVLIWIGL